MKARTKEPDFLDTGVTGAEIAAILGLSKRRVLQLSAAGIIQKMGRDRYSLGLGDYIEYRVAIARERHDKTMVSTDFELEQLRRIRQQNDRADEDLIARTEVENTIVTIVESIIKGIISIPIQSDATGIVFERATAVCDSLAMGIRTRSKRAIQKLANDQEIFDLKGM